MDTTKILIVANIIGLLLVLILSTTLFVLLDSPPPSSAGQIILSRSEEGTTSLSQPSSERALREVLDSRVAVKQHPRDRQILEDEISASLSNDAMVVDYISAQSSSDQLVQQSGENVELVFVNVTPVPVDQGLSFQSSTPNLYRSVYAFSGDGPQKRISSQPGQQYLAYVRIPKTATVYSARLEVRAE